MRHPVTYTPANAHLWNPATLAARAQQLREAELASTHASAIRTDEIRRVRKALAQCPPAA